MQTFKKLTSMELNDEEKLDAILPMPMTKPDYPCGLRIILTHNEFEKLGLDYEEAEVGAIFHGHFLARVTSVSSNDGDFGKTCRVEAQIEDLEIESEDEEDKEY